MMHQSLSKQPNKIKTEKEEQGESSPMQPLRISLMYRYIVFDFVQSDMHRIKPFRK